MSVVFAPVNNKGGVGKSEVAYLFADYFSRILKLPTCLIDMDPQCNISARVLHMELDPSAPEGMRPPLHPDYDPTSPEDANWDGRSSIADIFFGNGPVPYPTHIRNLDILPAHASKLLLAEQVRRSEVVEKIHDRLYEFLAGDDVQSLYKVIVIDTAPSKGPLTTSVMRAASHIIIPTIMEPGPIQGVYGMLQMWMQEKVRRSKSYPIQLMGILPNMVRNTTLHKDLFEALRNNESIGKYVLPSEVALGHRVAFAESSCIDSNPRSVFDLPETSRAKVEASALCDIIGNKVLQSLQEEEAMHA